MRCMLCGCAYDTGHYCNSTTPLKSSDTVSLSASVTNIDLRDYFAGQALAGWIANLRDAVDEYDGEDAAFMQHQHEVARTCYGYAGAMLKAREGTR
jgi:hypothetical protein